VFCESSYQEAYILGAFVTAIRLLVLQLEHTMLKKGKDKTTVD
jgi:hypothetical protein